MSQQRGRSEARFSAEPWGVPWMYVPSAEGGGMFGGYDRTTAHGAAVLAHFDKRLSEIKVRPREDEDA